MITERTLKKWRREALKALESLNQQDIRSIQWNYEKTFNERILRLTQILLDQHLMKGK